MNSAPNDEQPKKVPLEKIEVIDQRGHILQEAKDHSADASNAGGGFHPFGRFGGQMRVIHGGPFALLLIPIILPLLLFAMIFIAIFALLFGKSAFRVFKIKR